LLVIKFIVSVNPYLFLRVFTKSPCFSSSFKTFFNNLKSDTLVRSSASSISWIDSGLVPDSLKYEITRFFNFSIVAPSFNFNCSNLMFLKNDIYLHVKHLFHRQMLSSELSFYTILNLFFHF